MRRALALVLFAAAPALAQPEGGDALLPRPLPGPTLPEITHPGASLIAEHTFASLSLGAEREKTSISIHRLSFDLPLVPRRWYATGAWGVVLGPVAVSTNTELGIRAVWSSITGLAFGGGLTLVAPTTSVAPSGAAALALGEGAAVRQWDRPMFEPDTFAFRPFLDVRTTAGRFSAHLRQILDMVAASNTLLPLVESYRLAAVAILFVGFHVTSSFGVGVELTERYDVDAQTPDRERARFALSFSVRYRTRHFDPSIALTTALGSPLNAFSTIGAPFAREPVSFVGLRFSLGFGGFEPPWGR